ncbi:hypothetical protein GE09DRAFT_1210452 [Coniochaeta sp. 2T2.1]|nr:hypothetical protein GE09DRAFT_1210452 [Coniochaeta sp. 2T2.1]
MIEDWELLAEDHVEIAAAYDQLAGGCEGLPDASKDLKKADEQSKEGKKDKGKEGREGKKEKKGRVTKSKDDKDKKDKRPKKSKAFSEEEEWNGSSLPGYYQELDRDLLVV